MYRTVPGEPNNCLVVGTKFLPDLYHNSLMKAVESDGGQDADEFADFASRQTFPDGTNMLAMMHNDNYIKSKIKDGQMVMVGHIFLYNDRVKKIKGLLSRIGKIQHIESNRLNWGRYQKKISTLHSLAPHDVSIILYLLGYHEFEDIISIGDNFTNNIQNDRDEYSFICDDVSVKFNLSWYYPEKVRTMSITGEKGLIFWDEEARTIKLTTDIWQDGRMNYEPTVEMFNVESNSLRNELIEFVECVKEKRTPVSNVDNAIAVAKNLDLLFKSLGHN